MMPPKKTTLKTAGKQYYLYNNIILYYLYNNIFSPVFGASCKKCIHVVEGQSQEVVGDVATSQGEVLVTPPPSPTF